MTSLVIKTELLTNETQEQEQNLKNLVQQYFEAKKISEQADQQKKDAQNAIAELLGYKYDKELTKKQSKSFKGLEINENDFSVSVFSKGFTSLDKEKLFKIISEKQYKKCQNVSVKVQMRITKK
jgi:hypothetical protein